MSSDLYANAILYSEISQKHPELVSKMFNEATRKKLDAFVSFLLLCLKKF